MPLPSWLSAASVSRHVRCCLLLFISPQLKTSDTTSLPEEVQIDPLYSSLFTVEAYFPSRNALVQESHAQAARITVTHDGLGAGNTRAEIKASDDPVAFLADHFRQRHELGATYWPPGSDPRLVVWAVSQSKYSVHLFLRLVLTPAEVTPL